jgi:hypothetical protein
MKLFCNPFPTAYGFLHLGTQNPTPQPAGSNTDSVPLRDSQHSVTLGTYLIHEHLAGEAQIPGCRM